MGWEDELFAYLDDLEAQAAALYDAERLPELADRERAEYQQVTLAARLMASVDRRSPSSSPASVPSPDASTGSRTAGCVLSGHGQDWVVRTAAIVTAHGLSDRAVPEVAWSVVARLRIGSALRRLADGAVPCTLHLVDGRRHDGVVRRVGADFAEIATGESNRQLLVAFEQLAAVQSRR